MNILVTSPLTGSKNVTLIKNICVESLIQDWKHTLHTDITEEIHECQSIQLYQCDQTKLLFFMPVDVSGSDKLYEKLQKHEWYYKSHKWEHDVALTALRDAPSVIEIGTGNGHFIKQARDIGINIQGVEINRVAVEEAQKQGLPVSLMMPNEVVKKFRDSVDAVCCFQVLEHVENPRDFLEYLITLLKPGGRLILSVPNAESYLKYQHNLLDMPPHHMSKWSKTTFQALANIFPLKLENVLYEPLASYHVNAYLQAHSNRVPYRLRRLFFNKYTFLYYKKNSQPRR